MLPREAWQCEQKGEGTLREKLGLFAFEFVDSVQQLLDHRRLFGNESPQPLDMQASIR